VASKQRRQTAFTVKAQERDSVVVSLSSSLLPFAFFLLPSWLGMYNFSLNQPAAERGSSPREARDAGIEVDTRDQTTIAE
jgi:hypothetical protein